MSRDANHRPNAYRHVTDGLADRHNLPRWSYQTFALQTARALTLASIVYAAWRYGATDPQAFCHLSLSLGSALLLALTCKQTLDASANKLPVVLLGLTLLWIGYASLQQTTIASWLTAPFHGAASVQQQWGTERIVLLAEAVTRLDETRAIPGSAHFASVIPDETRQALVPFLLACAAAVLSALLFNTRQSRLVFLWTIAANAAALAFWGIIQKASGGGQILPGVENTFSSAMPFASFIYKNAGAAALLPGLAAIGAILYGQSSKRRQPSSTRIYHSGSTHLLETKNLALISLAILISVGLIASMSRGAWLAAVLAASVIALVSRDWIRRREFMIVGSAAAMGMLAIITIVGIGQDISSRAKQFSFESISHDQRWPQWVDGFSTAVAHLPSGSGLGTYGFATLPHQSSTRSSWFREAHNQYLEVLTESGLIGIVILSVGIVWFALASWRLIRKRHDREIRCWGYLGLALLVCGGFQSSFDFVLVIPANLILYASLVGIVGAVQRKHVGRDSRSVYAGNDQRLSSQRWSGLLKPLQSSPAWCVVALLCVVWSYRMARQQHFSEETLAATSVTRFESEPSETEISKCIASLSAAIDNQPQLALLYERRANWHLAAYRLDVLKAARREGIAIDWKDTQLEKLFELMNSLPVESRNALLAGLHRSRETRAKLAGGLSDLAFALSSNPLSPRSHLTCAAVAPLTGMPVKPWLDSAAALINNSSEMLYINGLLAIHSGQSELAVDQWSKSLSINHLHLTSILENAREKLPAICVAQNLIPSKRPDLLVQLVRSTRRESSITGESSYDRQLSKSIVKHLEADESVEPGLRHATIARIQQLIGDDEAAVDSWKAALREDARDPSFRLEYSQLLKRTGRTDEALEQALLGQSLYPLDARFKMLTTHLRRDIQLGVH